MSKPETFGSYGRRLSFGKLGAEGRVATIVTPSFGRRAKAPIVEVSLQKERLRILLAELIAIFHDPAQADVRMPFVLIEGDPCSIELGHGARIELDSTRGAFVFRRTSHPADVLTTTDHDRLMDAVVAHVARTSDGMQPESTLATIEKCVGRTVKDVERALVLATLRHCQGNRTHTARILGISLRTLRNKLHSYWRDLISEGEAAPAATKGDPAANVPRAPS